MMKQRAAGDEPDRWTERTIEEIEEAGFMDALDTARQEISNLSAAMIFEQGRDWTKNWYKLGLPETYDPEEELVVSEEAATRFLERAENSREAFDLLMHLVAACVAHGRPLPLPWRSRIAEHLLGSRLIGGARKRKTRPQTWLRDYMINHVARIVCARYGKIELTRGKETARIAASDIVFHALKDSDFKGLSFGSVQNRIFDPEKGEGNSRQSKLMYEEIRTLAIVSQFDDLPD